MGSHVLQHILRRLQHRPAAETLEHGEGHPAFTTTMKQRTGRGSGGVTGKGFEPGRSGNPGGRPRGLVSTIREQTNDGEELAVFVLEVLRNKQARLTDRIAAATWLADRGFGRPSQTIATPSRWVTNFHLHGATSADEATRPLPSAGQEPDASEEVPLTVDLDNLDKPQSRAVVR